MAGELSAPTATANGRNVTVTIAAVDHTKITRIEPGKTITLAVTSLGYVNGSLDTRPRSLTASFASVADSGANAVITLELSAEVFALDTATITIPAGAFVETGGGVSSAALTAGAVSMASCTLAYPVAWGAFLSPFDWDVADSAFSVEVLGAAPIVVTAGKMGIDSCVITVTDAGATPHTYTLTSLSDPTPVATTSPAYGHVPSNQRRACCWKQSVDPTGWTAAGMTVRVQLYPEIGNAACVWDTDANTYHPTRNIYNNTAGGLARQIAYYDADSSGTGATLNDATKPYASMRTAIAAILTATSNDPSGCIVRVKQSSTAATTLGWSNSTSTVYNNSWLFTVESWNGNTSSPGAGTAANTQIKARDATYLYWAGLRTKFVNLTLDRSVYDKNNYLLNTTSTMRTNFTSGELRYAFRDCVIWNDGTTVNKNRSFSLWPSITKGEFWGCKIGGFETGWGGRGIRRDTWFTIAGNDVLNPGYGYFNVQIDELNPYHCNSDDTPRVYTGTYNRTAKTVTVADNAFASYLRTASTTHAIRFWDPDLLEFSDWNSTGALVSVATKDSDTQLTLDTELVWDDATLPGDCTPIPDGTYQFVLWNAAHADVWQCENEATNFQLIINGVRVSKARYQLWWCTYADATERTGIAVINCHLKGAHPVDVTQDDQLLGGHIMRLHGIIHWLNTYESDGDRAPIYFGDGGRNNSTTALSIVGNRFTYFAETQGSSSTNPLWGGNFRDNHYRQLGGSGPFGAALSYGTGASTGADSLANGIPPAGSALSNRVATCPVADDIRGVSRGTLATVGAYEFAQGRPDNHWDQGQPWSDWSPNQRNSYGRIVRIPN